MTPEEAAEKQRQYREKRRRWAWKINRPYSGDLHDPDPGAAWVESDPEEG